MPQVMRGAPAVTRFRLFPQLFAGFRMPETVMIPTPPGGIGPGPSDREIYVVTPAIEKPPYTLPVYLPPYRGPQLAPAEPDRDGNFDSIPVEDARFAAAHLYGSVRFVLAMWQRYFGRALRRADTNRHPRLELITVVQWFNSHSGPGFIETGSHAIGDGLSARHCFNLDIVAHEVGHQVIFGETGVPTWLHASADYLGFVEAFCDMSSVLAALQFDSNIERLLEATGGNLYTRNLVTRLGESSETTEIRITINRASMAEFIGVRVTRGGQWVDPTGLDRRAHAFALPLIGAFFDVLVELFQDALVLRGVVPPDLDPRGWSREEVERSIDRLVAAGAAQLAAAKPELVAALGHARDVVGGVLARLAARVPANDLSYGLVAGAFLEACEDVGETANLEAIAQHFIVRGIMPETRRAAVPPPSRPPASQFERVQRFRASTIAASARCDEDEAMFVRLHRLMHDGCAPTS